MKQLELPLGRPADPRDTHFLVSDSNARAIQQLERWGSWPVMAGLLVGPRKSGRSLLARIFAAKTGGTMIDDAERAAEADIFHAWNRAQAERHPLIIVADAAPPAWKIRLPDLRSRLAATPLIEIGEPDDALVPLLLTQYMNRAMLPSDPKLIRFIAERIERSHVALHRAVDAIESEANQQRSRRLSIPGVRATLAAAGLLIEPSQDRLNRSP